MKNSKTNRVFIRVDMNSEIATGHLVRCISIADAVKKMGGEVAFVLADNTASEILKNKGFEIFVLDSDWSHLESEIDDFITLLNDSKVDYLLIDSYMVTKDYLAAISNVVNVMYIDDLNSFEYPVHSIVSYAIYSDEFDYEKINDKVKIYSGTKYAPLRSDFNKLPQKRISKNIESVLLVSGGTDHYNVLETIIDELLFAEINRIDVICGIMSNNYEHLIKKYSLTTNIYIHKSIPNIVDYMQDADVAISAGGTTLYELCACGTPAMSFCIADNQIENTRIFNDLGIIDFLGDARNDNISLELKKTIRKYKPAHIREKKSREMQRLVDGNGAMRIAEILLNLKDTIEWQ